MPHRHVGYMPYIWGLQIGHSPLVIHSIRFRDTAASRVVAEFLGES